MTPSLSPLAAAHAEKRPRRRFGASSWRGYPSRAVPGPGSIVVIGNGMVGFKLVQALINRQSPPRRSLVVFGEEPDPAYDRVHLTQLLSGRASDQLLLAAPTWYEENNVQLHLGDPIIAVDRDRRVVRSARGHEVPYQHLVFATGARPFIPAIPGTDLPGVFVYRTVADMRLLRAQARTSKSAVVLGGGLLGLEGAHALLQLGLDTQVIERGTGLLARQLDPTAAALLKDQVESLGLKVRLGLEATSIEMDGSQRLLHFQTKETIRTDLVVLAVGIRPRDDLAAACGLKVGSRGGIEVNDYLQTSDPSIYAIGECAAHRGTIYGLVAPGYKMADALAACLAGQRRKFIGADHSTRLKLAGLEVATLGDYQADGNFIQVQTAEAYRRLVVKNKRLLGAVSIGPWPEMARLQEAVASRQRLWKWQLDRFERNGRIWGNKTPLPIGQWPAQTTVCSCAGVTHGALSVARQGGCQTVQSLTERTGAGGVCGACKPLLAELLELPETFRRAAGLRALGWVSGGALALTAAFALLPAVHFSNTVQPRWRFDQLWQEAFWRQATGFTLLGLCLLSLLLSLRKRWRLLNCGEYGLWRTAHAMIGVLTLLLLVTHTGLRLGQNLNLILSLNFLGLALLGAGAGAVTALEGKLNGPSGRWLRRAWTGAHLLMAWPLPALILFHVFIAYYF